ncbi:MAG: RCC1 domain-containing protein, partial [Planctomycetota bacterium]
MKKLALIPTLGLCGTLLLVGCATDDGPTAPVAAPQLEISDGAHEGNEHFYFLPPMVDQPSHSGTFDGSLKPEVQICIWDGSDCGAPLDIYNTETGPGSETVRVGPEDEHYIVNWHTDYILENFELADGEVYRIRVIAGAGVLGHADVEVVENGRDLKNVDTDEYIPLLDGRTLPIKFRIEEGAVGYHEIVSVQNTGACTVDASGTAYCWGRNWHGKLGDGTTTNSSSPVAVLGGHTWRSVEVGGRHTCGVTTDNDAYCWGWNGMGQLGDGSTADQLTPVPVTGGHKFQSVSAAGQHTCGLTQDGDAYCWGWNGNGQLGDGTTTYYSVTPVAVIGGHTFQSLHAQHRTACAITTDGTAFCWGDNRQGQLGVGYASNGERTPVAVTGGHRFRSLNNEWMATCGTTTSGDGYCWGRNRGGQLGAGYMSDYQPTPVAVIGGHTFQYVSAGSNYGESSCGLTTDGAVFCWGGNYHGQLGRGFTSSYELTPAAVIGGHTF